MNNIQCISPAFTHVKAHAFMDRVDEMLRDVVFTFPFAYVLLIVTFLLGGFIGRPKFDNSHLYDSYPKLTAQQVLNEVESIKSAVRNATHPEDYFVQRSRLERLDHALARMHNEIYYGISSELWTDYQMAWSFTDSQSRFLIGAYDDRFGELRMREVRIQHAEKLGKAGYLKPAYTHDVRAVEWQQTVEVTKFFCWWYFIFLCPGMVFLQYRRKGLSVSRDAIARPWRLLLAAAFMPFALYWGFPREDWREQAKNTLHSLAVLVAIAFSCGMAPGIAKAQGKDGDKKKQQGFGFLLDYRRTDAVAGDGPGGLSNTLFAQAERVPHLPKRMLVQSLCVFSKDSYQCDFITGSNLKVPLSGLTLTPVAGVQLNNGSDGVVVGTEAVYKNRRLAVGIPSIWWERTFGPKSSTTFWVVARPFVRVNSWFSVGGEYGRKQVYGKSVTHYGGPGVEFRFGKTRLNLFGFFKPNVEVFRSRWIYSH